uniref:Peroxisomal biogenesis factor 6 (ClaPEX6) (Peroxin-6) n=1 Tax=Ganoderma boninense TaxID=34458 RepID=A0A5K1K2F9_9APHY|nr:Peroxisomal biogenesis factor 6 (ClaPEX6) (Peroxin-6) [Ganoderma boninense]
MPLPPNSTLILQGQPRPEDTTLSHLKPKKAMLIRMSQETFEALKDGENHSKVEFDFGKTPGLYIGNTFYPVMPTQEHSIHEMYIRVQQASKQNVPLKPYATVVGKFRVQRELGEKVQETVRDRTLEAEKQRTERKAIFLDAPPALPAHNSRPKAKKQAVSTSRTTIQAKSYVSKPSPLPSSNSRIAPPPPSSSSRTNAPLPSSSSRTSTASTPATSSADRDTRMRLIHCLALNPRSASAVFIMCLGKERTEDQEKEIAALLEQVAEHPLTAKKSEGSSLWQLKLEAWREVRPYEFAKYNAEERNSVARQARLNFKTMKIPETDPIWNYVNYRNTSSAAPGPSAPEKNGVVMTKSAKKTKTGETTRKRVSDIAIPSKDESGKGKVRDTDEGSAAGTPTSATRPGARRLPGSGFRVKPSATPPIMEPRANSPLPPPRKTVSSDAREGKRSALEASSSAKPVAPVAPSPAQESRSSSVAAAAAKIRKRDKEGPGLSSTSRSAESRREERDRDRERERERVRDRDSAADEKPRMKERASPVPPPPPALPSFKRKKRPEDGNDSEFSERERPLSASLSKKRKLDADTQASPARGRDLSLPKKPIIRESSPLAPPRPKIKKEPSPFSIAFSPPRSSLPPNPRSSLPPKPPVAEKQQSSSSTTSVKVSRTVENAPPPRTSGKSKRKSPIYTSSSEDESEASVPVSRTRNRAPLRDAPSEEPPVKRPRPTSAAHVSRFKPRTLPSDLPSLRKYYKLCYSRYMDLFGEAKKRRERIQRMLKRVDSTRERGEESARSDEDNDDLVPEVLAGFMDEMNAVSQEMKKVMKEWKKLGGKVEGGKPVLE